MNGYYDYTTNSFRSYPVVNKVDKPKVGKLVWLYCGKEEVIKDNFPFAFLQNLKSKLSKEPQYKNGKLIIKY